MKLDKNISKISLLSFTLMSLGSENKTEAGIVKIINTSEVPTKINILSAPNESPSCAKCLGSPLQMCGQEATTIVVSLDTLNAGEYVSIIDVSNGFMGGGKCKNLNVFKNYEVSFFDTTLGTRCQYKEM